MYMILQWLTLGNPGGAGRQRMLSRPLSRRAEGAEETSKAGPYEQTSQSLMRMFMRNCSERDADREVDDGDTIREIWRADVYSRCSR